MKLFSSHQNVCENQILNSLPFENYERIRPHLEEVCLPVGKNLYECGDVIDYVYFPLDAVIQLFITMKCGATVEIGMVSSEGVFGLPVFMGAKTLSCQAIVLHSARALRIKAEIIKHEFSKNEWFQQSILRYIHIFSLQISQIAGCHRIHQIEDRLCRWLLMLSDRLKTDHLNVTQDFIAQMIGANRPSVTTVAGLLQKKGLIKLERGSVKISDKFGLEKNCCECYEIIRREFAFLHQQYLSAKGNAKQISVSRYVQFPTQTIQ